MRFAAFLWVIVILVSSGMIYAGGEEPVSQTDAGEETADGAEEKLLQGFEEKALKKAVSGRVNKSYIFEVEEDTIRFGRTSGYSGGYTWYHKLGLEAAKEKVTEGEYALKTVVPIQIGVPNRPDPTTRRNWAVFASCVGVSKNWNEFSAFFPRDWSDYELLRIDLHVERPEMVANTQVQVRICDEELDPPLNCTYDVPPDQWVTLELDLERAVKERGLAPDKMSFFLLVLGPQQTCQPRQSKTDYEKGIVYVDNIRLAKREAKATLPVLKDDTGFEILEPRAYAVDHEVIKVGKREKIGWKAESMELPEPAGVEPAPGPKKLEAPCVIDLTAYKEIDPDRLSTLSLGEEMAALGAKRILVPFRCSLIDASSAYHGEYHDRHDKAFTLVLGSADGGATWKGLDGKARPFPLTNSHHRPGFCVANGGDLFIFSDFGCQGTGHSYPIDKGFVRRTVSTAEGWWVSPYYFVDPHELHCIGWHTGVAQPSGRIWGVRPSYWTFRPPAISAKYSDDGGRTWQGWKGPGRYPAVPGLGSDSASVVPYGDHVAVLGQGRGKRPTAKMVVFDGTGWSEPAPCPALPRGVAVSVGGREIFMPARDGVWHFDGTAWKQELELPRGTKARIKLAVCGETVLSFHLDETKKKLLCRRRVGGIWSEPVPVASEETESAGFTTQHYAPADFAPVAYICREEATVVQALIEKGVKERSVRRFKPWIKVVKVPARTSQSGE